MPRERLRLADYKVPGGKLVRIRLLEKDGNITTVTITGDFFLIPEDSLPGMEKMLQGTQLREEEVRQKIGLFFGSTRVQTLGVSADDFAKAILSSRTVD